MQTTVPGGSALVLAAAEALPFGVAITDPRGIITWANASYARLSDCALDELPGQSAGDFAWDTLAHAAPSSEPWPGPAADRGKKGQAGAAESSIAALRNSAGEVTGFWVMKRDAAGLARPAGAPAEAGAHLSALIESTTDLIWSVDLGYRLLTLNTAMYQAIERNFGVQAKVGTRFEDLFPPERAAFFLALYQRVLVEGPLRAEYSVSDGRTLELSLHPIRQGDRTVGISVFGKDISQRKAAEQALGEAHENLARRRIQDALRKSEEKFAKAFRSSPAMVSLCDPGDNFRLLDVNQAFEEVLGYSREELIGRSPEELGVWVDSGEMEESRRRYWETGHLHTFERQFRRRNGDIGVCLTSSEPIELEGKPCAIVVTIDITAQKKAEETMRSLVTAIEQSVDTILITNLEGVIQYCNPAFEKVSGYSRQEAIGLNPRLLKSGKHPPEFYAQMWATITRGQVWSGHLTNRRKDGSLYEESATISPIRDASGKASGFVAVKQDVTERRQLEDQLRQAQKLESVGRLAGGVAHDFNNLLTVINGYCGFLLKELKPGDPLRSYADEIKTAGARAIGLTRQLLAFSRKQVIEPRVLDLNTTIRQSVPMLQRLIGEDIALQADLDDALGRVMADPDQMNQVIMNLAVNARDAMPDGGRLDIATANTDLAADACAALHPEATAGRYVLLTVTDNGYGMDETIRQHVFEPFFTTKDVGKGTGLGLSTVYGIIRQGGGCVAVSSELGVGTSVRIYLPRIDADTVADRGTVSTPIEQAGETILVVEDQASVRAFTAASLGQCGYQVLDAPDGYEAIAVSRRHPGQIHLLVTDVVMPGINGKELSARLQELYPDLKVLYISGYTADVIANHGVLDRGVAFLHKPFSPGELAGKVREVLSQPAAP